MTVVPLGRDDVAAWKRLRMALWPRLRTDDNDRECAYILEQPDRFAVFVARSGSGEALGFVEASLRQYADGCDSSPVGYLEGWFVEAPVRRTGVGRRLVAAAEAWARACGCTEMASDSLVENLDGQRAHARLGYEEVERQVCFRKDLAR